jgi:hypothetical protein
LFETEEVHTKVLQAKQVVLLEHLALSGGIFFAEGRRKGVACARATRMAVHDVLGGEGAQCVVFGWSWLHRAFVVWI